MTNVSPSDEAESWILTGKGFLKRREFKNALGAFERALAIDANNVEAWYYKGETLKASVCDLLPEEKQRLWNAFDRKEVDHDLYLAEDPIYEAIKAYDHALKIDATAAYIWEAKGLALFEDGQWEEAIIACDHALAIEPKNFSCLCWRAFSLYARARWDEALAAFDIMLEIDPANGGAWLHKAMSLYQLKIYEQAVAAFDQALALNPDEAAASLAKRYKGIALYYLNRFEDALSVFSPVYPELMDNYMDEVLHKGMSLCALGRFEEALAVLDVVPEFYPGAKIHKGKCLYGLDRFKEALTIFERVQTWEDECAEAQRYKALILDRENGSDPRL
jgi:tetratricopeptide (TPR) repeat protein